jgi:acyl-CoA synthetase (NDP forming)
MANKNQRVRGSSRLDPLLSPRSIALLGASTVPDSFGQALWDMATSGGFDGAIHPVNPRYVGMVDGFHARLKDLPEPVEHVVLGVANERVETCFLDAVEHGAKAVTIFAEGKSDNLPTRIREIARDADILVCGPNSMGFHNLDRGLRISPFPAPKSLTPGGVAAILQSGSVMGALAHNDRRLRFNMLVSPGSEYVQTAADYLDWALDQPTTRVVGMFLESVRDPDGFLAALRRADELRVPVVILKVGRTDLARRMAMSHTGALVGNHQVFEAVCRENGALLVDTVDELAATLQIFAMGKPAAPGGIASLHDSGGERELLVDSTESMGLPLATLSEDTVAKIQPYLEPGVKAENPMDAWASGKDAERTFLQCARGMMADDDVGVGLYVLDWRQDYYLHAMHARVLKQAAGETEKPLLAMTNYSLTVNHDLACELADAGVALLEGTSESLKAVGHLLAHRDRVAKDHPIPPASPIERVGDGEAAGFALLTEYGIEVPPHAVADTVDAAAAAAERIGYPVAMKTAVAGIAHKTEAGGVVLNVADEPMLRTVYRGMADRLGPEVIVTGMVAGKAEWSLGVINDPDFGPAVVIGPGGVLIELLPERAVLTAPFGPEAARAAIESLRAGRLLTGYRGQAPLAVDKLAEAAAALSRLAHDGRDVIAELDVNPVLITPTRAVAVDVLIRAKDSSAAG